jgi:hypothetical protein
VTHDEVAVAGLFTNDIDQPNCLVHVVRVGVNEDRAVVEAFGSGDEDVGHVVAVQFAFLLLHLPPLAVIAMRRMHLAEGFHREEKDQLEMCGTRPVIGRRSSAAMKRSLGCIPAP